MSKQQLYFGNPSKLVASPKGAFFLINSDTLTAGKRSFVHGHGFKTKVYYGLGMDTIQ